MKQLALLAAALLFFAAAPDAAQKQFVGIGQGHYPSGVVVMTVVRLVAGIREPMLLARRTVISRVLCHAQPAATWVATELAQWTLLALRFPASNELNLCQARYELIRLANLC